MADILVIDDETGIQSFLREMLEHDGHAVTVAGSGAEALAQIAAREFDLALIDLRLGDLDGLQVLAALRARWPLTSAIVLTAHASLDTAVEALRQGAHDYLFKPCRTVTLRESVRSGLRKREEALGRQALVAQLAQVVGQLSGAASAPGAAGTPAAANAPAALPPAPGTPENAGRFVQQSGLIVDLLRHVITLDGSVLELTATEFALVAYLAEEAPRVVPAQELVRAVQGYESEPREARETLRYHVHRIRQKVRTATGRETPFIATVRGVGYRLTHA